MCFLSSLISVTFINTLSAKCGKLLNLAETLVRTVTCVLSNCTIMPELFLGKAITAPIYSPFIAIYFLILQPHHILVL